MGKIYGSYVPTLVVDFDGVLHAYESPWTSPWTIPDAPVEGAIEWLTKEPSRLVSRGSPCRSAPAGRL